MSEKPTLIERLDKLKPYIEFDKYYLVWTSNSRCWELQHGTRVTTYKTLAAALEAAFEVPDER